MKGNHIRVKDYPSKAGLLSSLKHPSIALYDPKGKLRKVEWMWKEKLHRKNGPAEIWYAETGETHYAWHIRGNMITDNTTFQRRAKLTDEAMLALVLKYGNVC